MSKCALFLVYYILCWNGDHYTFYFRPPAHFHKYFIRTLSSILHICTRTVYIHIEHSSKEEKNTATKTMTWYLQVFSFYSLFFCLLAIQYSVCFHNSNNQPANINTMTNISHSTFEITKLTLLNLLILLSITNQRKITFLFRLFI